MNYAFVAMNHQYASRIVDTWKYGETHAIYDYVNEADHMLDEDGWGRGIFAVLDEEGELIGELSIEFYDAQGEYTEYCDFDHADLLTGRELWIGFGLRPDLVGKGHGTAFVSACVDYAIERFRYREAYIYLGVAAFNQRAVKAYEKAGFEVFNHTAGEISGETFDCVHMRKKLMNVA